MNITLHFQFLSQEIKQKMHMHFIYLYICGIIIYIAFRIVYTYKFFLFYHR